MGVCIFKTQCYMDFKVNVFISMLITGFCYCWLPDTSTKMVNIIGQIKTLKFIGNSTYPDHFIVLHQDNISLILGGRNNIYNLSVFDFHERPEYRVTWLSTDAHEQLCILKGKTEDDCQNYIRILVPLSKNKLIICGTNSYKPLCRHYLYNVSFNFTNIFLLTFYKKVSFITKYNGRKSITLGSICAIRKRGLVYL